MRVKYALSARESCAGTRASFTNDVRASNGRGLGLAMRRFLLMRIDVHQMRIDAHEPYH